MNYRYLKSFSCAGLSGNAEKRNALPNRKGRPERPVLDKENRFDSVLFCAIYVYSLMVINCV